MIVSTYCESRLCVTLSEVWQKNSKSYHDLCTSCSGFGAPTYDRECSACTAGKTSCGVCYGNGFLNCETCEGRGHLIEPYSCSHERSGGNSHYYCTHSSAHGNFVEQYH